MGKAEGRKTKEHLDVNGVVGYVRNGPFALSQTQITSIEQAGKCKLSTADVADLNRILDSYISYDSCYRNASTRKDQREQLEKTFNAFKHLADFFDNFKDAKIYSASGRIKDQLVYLLHSLDDGLLTQSYHDYQIAVRNPGLLSFKIQEKRKKDELLFDTDNLVTDFDILKVATKKAIEKIDQEISNQVKGPAEHTLQNGLYQELAIFYDKLKTRKQRGKENFIRAIINALPDKHRFHLPAAGGIRKQTKRSLERTAKRTPKQNPKRLIKKEK